MAEIKLLRLTKWGVNHVARSNRTLCLLKTERTLPPREDRRLCVDCKRKLMAEEAHDLRVRVYGEEVAARIEKERRLLR